MPAERTMPSPKVAQVEARAIIPQRKVETSDILKRIEATFVKHGVVDMDFRTLLVFRQMAPAERAEYAWSLYRDALADVSGEQIKAKEGKMSEEGKTKLALSKSLLRDSEVRAVFDAAVGRHIAEREIRNGSYKEYREQRRRIKNAERMFDEAARHIFSARDAGQSKPLNQTMFQQAKLTLEAERESLETSLETFPHLSARVSWERLRKHQTELAETKFCWFDSRRKILEQIEAAALETQGRPILLEGESGTGKTSLVAVAAKNLTGLMPFKGPLGEHVRLQDALLSREIEGGASFIGYGALTQAMSGKASSRDQEPKHQGGVYVQDELNALESDAQFAIVKAASGVMPGQPYQLPFVGHVEVQPNFLFIAMQNKASPKYPRHKTDVAVRREFAKTIQVPYLEQTADNPELFELFLVSLMDSNGRMRMARSDLEPPFKKDTKDPSQEAGVDKGDGRIERQLLDAPKQGGALWRFAQAIDQLYKSVSGPPANTVLSARGDAQYLRSFVRDPGIYSGWLQSYRDTGERKPLNEFLNVRIQDLLATSGLTDDDAKIVRDIFKHYGFIAVSQRGTSAQEKAAPAMAILTPEAIGRLSPRVKFLAKEGYTKIESGTVVIDGQPVTYSTRDLPSALIEKPRKEPTSGLLFSVIGRHPDGRLVLREVGSATNAKLVPEATVAAWEEAAASRPEPKKRREALEPWEEQIIERSRKWHQEFFGKVFDHPPLPRAATKERAELWERLGFELLYLPPVVMQESDNYPRWKKKPGKRHTPNQQHGIEFFDELQAIQDFPENKANPHLAGLALNALPGCWILRDTRKKPNYDQGKQAYENDVATQTLLKQLATQNILNPEAKDGLRNNIHPSVFDKPEFWQAFRRLFDLEDAPDVTIRLPRVVEQNVMGQGPEWDGTRTYEWSEEYYRSGYRLIAGDSDSGGASRVAWYVRARAHIGFRPQVVFSHTVGDLEPWDLELWNEKMEKLRSTESRNLSTFFEKQIDVPPVPAEFTPERLEKWEQLGLEVHYIPPEKMTKGRKLKKWKKRPNDWFYQQISEGKLPPTALELPAGWYVLDGRSKPSYQEGDQMYENDPLADALRELNRRGLISQTNYDKSKQLDPSSRFGLSPDDFEKSEVINALAEALDIPPANLSLPPAILSNFLANLYHPEWGETDTSEWQKETYGSGTRLVAGSSDHGGASYVSWHDRAYAYFGFRPLGRFSS